MTYRKEIFRSLLAFLMMATFCVCTFAADASLENDRDAAKELTVNAPSIKITTSGLEISNPDEDSIEVAVYALTGQLVKLVTVAPGTSTLELSPGFYIVKCGTVTKRVAIK